MINRFYQDVNRFSVYLLHYWLRLIKKRNIVF